MSTTPSKIVSAAYETEHAFWHVVIDPVTSPQGYAVYRLNEKIRDFGIGPDANEAAYGYKEKRARAAAGSTAIRVLASLFQDPVVVNALLWAAGEGEVKV